MNRIFKKGEAVTLVSKRPDFWNDTGRMDNLLGATVILPTGISPGGQFKIDNWFIRYEDIIQEPNHTIFN